MINPGWRGEYCLQQDLEGRRAGSKRLVGSLHFEPATPQRIRQFDMERIQDRYKLDPDADDLPADFTLAYNDLVRVDGVLTEIEPDIASALRDGDA